MVEIRTTIHAVEGFDMVGKDYLMSRNLILKKPHPGLYRPDYSLFDKFLVRNDAWVINFSIIDYLSKCGPIIPEMFFNRFIVSSLVYSELYGGNLHTLENLKLIYDWYNKDAMLEKGFEVKIYHVCHSDPESAMKILVASKERDVVEELDKFDTFESYWALYQDAERLFRKYYDLLGYDVTYIPNKFGE